VCCFRCCACSSVSTSLQEQRARLLPWCRRLPRPTTPHRTARAGAPHKARAARRAGSMAGTCSEQAEGAPAAAAR
jgi:hypothetical protein